MYAFFIELRWNVLALLLALGMWLPPRAMADDHYVAKNGQTPGAPYTTWLSAASNIQDAVNITSEGDTVWVGAGRYTVPPNPTNFANNYNVVYITNHIALCSSNGVPESTIIDGSATNRGIAFWCYSKVGQKQFMIDGFTISNCWVTNAGAGILIRYENGAAGASGTCTVQNCIISDNTVAFLSSSLGGGIYGHHQSSAAYWGLNMSNCVVRRNQALYGPVAGNQSYGGGMYFTYAILRMTNCTVEDCTASVGGGICGGYAYLENCTITRNRAKIGTAPGASVYEPRGGGMYLSGASTLRNCLLLTNISECAAEHCRFAAGAGAYYYLENCTITGGKGGTSGYGGPIYLDAANIVCVNSIICSNTLGMTLPFQASIIFPGTARGYITNCFIAPFPGYSMSPTNFVVTGSITGTNIAPNFANFGQDFRLALSSPCINAGFNQSWMGTTKDLDRYSRIDRFSGTVDMGCYEYHSRGVMFKMR
jgi:hypothetical protein